MHVRVDRISATRTQWQLLIQKTAGRLMRRSPSRVVASLISRIRVVPDGKRRSDSVSSRGQSGWRGGRLSSSRRARTSFARARVSASRCELRTALWTPQQVEKYGALVLGEGRKLRR